MMTPQKLNNDMINHKTPALKSNFISHKLPAMNHLDLDDGNMFETASSNKKERRASFHAVS